MTEEETADDYILSQAASRFGTTVKPSLECCGPADDVIVFYENLLRHKYMAVQSQASELPSFESGTNLGPTRWCTAPGSCGQGIQILSCVSIYAVPTQYLFLWVEISWLWWRCACFLHRFDRVSVLPRACTQKIRKQKYGVSPQYILCSYVSLGPAVWLIVVEWACQALVLNGMAVETADPFIIWFSALSYNTLLPGELCSLAGGDNNDPREVAERLLPRRAVDPQIGLSLILPGENEMREAHYIVRWLRIEGLNVLEEQHVGKSNFLIFLGPYGFLSEDAYGPLLLNE
ncbi:hypothetical protein CEXT_193131 [Caerostris extrusa]|uniref:Uncharacterized protein n=1 Tax=Caerostris extrusa TaxID=172846 RepID=A0AAV4RYG9_CAEEX|nr:hypothetical protein CEXT_193001 [Caerostris extrusa]GIY25167.1 hypothetical protein CEXT_193131 [Caerostris extrusa]